MASPYHPNQTFDPTHILPAFIKLTEPDVNFKEMPKLELTKFAEEIYKLVGGPLTSERMRMEDLSVNVTSFTRQKELLSITKIGKRAVQCKLPNSNPRAQGIISNVLLDPTDAEVANLLSY